MRRLYPSQLGVAYPAVPMQHENLTQSLENLAARMVKLRDSL
ncbi:MAG: hypothetical protein AAF743_17490 [Planctomycetota bacterium]